MSTAPRRSLAGTFAPAPRSAGLLEALPTRNLRSIEPDPASTDAPTEDKGDLTGAGQQPAPATPAVQAKTAPHIRSARAPQDRGEPVRPTSEQPAATPLPAPTEDKTTPNPGNLAGAEAGTESNAEPAGESTSALDTGAPTPKPADEATPAAAPTTVANGVPGPQVAGRGSADDVVRSVAVYLSPTLLARLKHTAHEQQVTYADVLVRAANTHTHTLAGRFAAAQSPASPTGGMPARATPARGSGGIQTQLRLDGHQIAWLDLTVRQTGAPSRSALVSALLDAALPASTRRA